MRQHDQMPTLNAFCRALCVLTLSIPVSSCLGMMANLIMSDTPHPQYEGGERAQEDVAYLNLCPGPKEEIGVFFADFMALDGDDEAPDRACFRWRVATFLSGTHSLTINHQSPNEQSITLRELEFKLEAGQIYGFHEIGFFRETDGTVGGIRIECGVTTNSIVTFNRFAPSTFTTGSPCSGDTSLPVFLFFWVSDEADGSIVAGYRPEEPIDWARGYQCSAQGETCKLKRSRRRPDV